MFKFDPGYLASRSFLIISSCFFDNFSIEIDSMAKKVKEDYEKYQRFNNSLK